jgi:hypothetical protein
MWHILGLFVSMKLEEYQKIWAEDAKVSNDEIGEYSRQQPFHHSKYMNYLSNERLLWKKAKRKRIEWEQTLQDYYTGKLDGKDIGRSPWHLTETKEAIAKRILSDKKMMTIDDIIDEKEEVVLFLKEVITNINQRSFNMGNTISFLKWKQGE